MSELERQRQELIHDPYAEDKPDRSPQPTPKADYSDPNRNKFFTEDDDSPQGLRVPQSSEQGADLDME